ncbi:MAG: AAA family ATPase [Minisyncoccia bacterium]
MRIERARLINGQTLEFGDFNVFIGGNGVGKTTVLLEMFSRIAATTRNKYHWVEELTYGSDDTPRDMGLIKSTLKKVLDGARRFYYSPATKNINGDADTQDGNLRFTENEFAEMDATPDATRFTTDVRYRRPFVSFMSCEARLGVSNSVGLAGFQSPPPDPVNVLYRDPGLLRNISDRVFQRFGYRLVLLSHAGIQLELGISREMPPVLDAALPVGEIYEAIETWKNEKFIPITEAGHGMRSMIRLLISLLEPVNQVILIDEPEIHLYPRHKRWLGKELVSLARNQHKQVFVVTHDPMILQGILDATTTTRIFRVDRDDSDQGVVTTCDFDAITNAGAIKNQEQYLQGLFYQRCVIVEGASDRSFYANIFDDYPDLEDKDVGLVVSGGAGNAKHLAEIVSKIGLKAAFIFDQDVLFCEPHSIGEIYRILGGTDDVLAPLRTALNAIPEIAAAPNNGKIIKQQIGYSDKTGVGTAWKTSNQAVLDTVIPGLESKGIFLVPNGSLESWAPLVEEKKRFAEMAPDVIRVDTALQNPLKDFARKVFRFVEIELT